MYKPRLICAVKPEELVVGELYYLNFAAGHKNNGLAIFLKHDFDEPSMSMQQRYLTWSRDMELDAYARRYGDSHFHSFSGKRKMPVRTNSVENIVYVIHPEGD